MHASMTVTMDQRMTSHEEYATRFVELYDAPPCERPRMAARQFDSHWNLDWLQLARTVYTLILTLSETSRELRPSDLQAALSTEKVLRAQNHTPTSNGVRPAEHTTYLPQSSQWL